MLKLLDVYFSLDDCCERRSKDRCSLRRHRLFQILIPVLHMVGPYHLKNSHRRSHKSQLTEVMPRSTKNVNIYLLLDFFFLRLLHC